MGEWDAGTYEGKDSIIRVVRDEAKRFFALAEPAAAWDAPTACPEWITRDVVGHIVDTTEGYFSAFDAAHGKGEAGPGYGLPAMSARAGAHATAFRDQSQQAMMTRLREDFEKMMAILEPLNAAEWTGFMVQHPYMGPLPASFYAAGQLMDYGVHSWDVRQGSQRGHALSGDAADLLVPYMFVLWQYTIRADADLTPFDIGIRIISGHNSGDYRVSISPDGMSYDKGGVDDLPAVLEFDAGSMVLATFGRINAGTVRGDYTLADRFLNLFFRI